MGEYAKLGLGVLGVALIVAFLSAEVYALPVEDDGASLLAGLLFGALFLDYAWSS